MNPLLQIQYSGLCWEYAKREDSLRPEQYFAQISIDSAIKIAEKKMSKYPSDIIDKLEWALKVALNIKDNQKAEKLRDVILCYEEDIAQDNLCGLWGFSYDFLIENRHTRKILTPEIEKQIIDRLEKRLDRLVAAPDDKLAANEYAAQLASTRLADYYKKKNLLTEMQTALSRYTDLVFNIRDDSAIRSAFLLRKLFHIVRSYDLNEIAKTVAVKLRETEKKTLEEMKTHEYKFEVNQKEIESFVDAITADGLEAAVQIIIMRYIPDLDEYYIKLHDFANKYVGVYRLFPKCVTDHKGRTVATN
jgi:hypothetical protein